MKGYLFNSPLCGMNWTQKYRRVVDKIERVAGTPHAPRHRTQGLSTEKQRWGWKKPTDHNYVPVETNYLISQTFLQGSHCVYLDIHASNIQPKSLLPFQLSKGRQKMRESHQGSLLVQTVRRWTFPSTTQVIRCSEEKKEVSQKMWSRDHYIPHLPQRLDCFWLSWQVAAFNKVKMCKDKLKGSELFLFKRKQGEYATEVYKITLCSEGQKRKSLSLHNRHQ